ncbi:3-hydroxyisobutyryl-CoA hydrolase, mitochondrial [Thelohanellus kitauei]|uniref:3-hydroxyisobutyryl-CoA hydrolase, mitochondrial n=1 Tax=Thelohanellus kitauei TaxID=669202 RepID=A0A0C2MW77_THEKT|nr:3-hydroxyisobutyryl-CoA hydrolase, mitochondrial [Thelohanellus kitauei]
MLKLARLSRLGLVGTLSPRRGLQILENHGLKDSVDAIRTHVERRVGYIVLNRPNAYNALTLEMIDLLNETFDSMNNDPYITCIALKSSSENFCAGLDFPALYQNAVVENRENKAIISYKDLSFNRNYFSRYYKLLYKIHECKKALVSFIPGVCVGSALSLAQLTNGVLLVEPVCSLPQVSMGFFPDSALCRLCAKLPNNMGKYHALTGNKFDPYELVWYDILKRVIPDMEWDYLGPLEILSEDPNVTRNETTELYSKMDSALIATGDEIPFQLYLKHQIDDAFSHKDLETILYVVRRLCIDTLIYRDFWIQTYTQLISASPISLKVTLKYLNMAKDISFKEAIKLDYRISLNFARHIDFYRGIHSKYHKKDSTPRWAHKFVDDITDEEIDRFFQLPPGEEDLDI